MTTEDKLQHFMEITVEDANAKNAKELADYEKAMQQILREHKENATRKAELKVKLEEENLKKNKNTEIVKEQLAIKREVGKHQDELKQRLFAEVKNQLEQYMATREYQDYLIAQINHIKEFARKEPVTIYIDSADSEKVSSLLTATNIEIEVAKQGFIGGVKGVIPSKNILLDYSFQSRLQEAQDAFTFQNR